AHLRAVPGAPLPALAWQQQALTISIQPGLCAGLLRACRRRACSRQAWVLRRDAIEGGADGMRM
ncbi:hypothetical protein N0791_27080, partial [Pseudomonas aeruginosa]|nr:hypothetical protein [Pseudomonas aeruginosa]